TRTNRSNGSPPSHGLLVHWPRTLLNGPGASQELVAQDLFGGIADEPGLLKDEADGPFGEGFEREACDAPDRQGDRLQRHAPGPAVLRDPLSPHGAAGAAPAGELQRGYQLGKLGPARGPGVLPRPEAPGLDRSGGGRQSGAEDPERGGAH